jgi:HK97 family phage major capsid protein
MSRDKYGSDEGLSAGAREVVQDLADGTRKYVDDRVQPLEKWLSEVERKANSARYSVGGGDNFVRAIPPEYRGQLDIAERLGVKDAPKKAWEGLWWRSVLLAAKAPFLGQSPQPHLVLRDQLEKAAGYDRSYAAEFVKGSLGDGTGGGGSVIATPVEATLQRLILDNTIVRPLATKIVMTSITHQIPIENSNVSAFIVSEFGTISDALPSTTFAQRALTAKVFAGLATLSNQILQDNIIGLQDYLFASIAEQIGRLEDAGALDGGTPTVQNFSGVAVSPSVNSFNCSLGAVSGGSIPTYGELVQQIYTASQIATRDRGAFFMIPAAFKNIASLIDTTGQPIFSFANVPNAIPQMLGGYPVYLVSSLSTQWTLGTTTTNIYYGPASKILFGDIAGMQFDIDPYSLLDKIQTRVRVMRRTAITVPVGQFFTIMKTVKAT